MKSYLLSLTIFSCKFCQRLNEHLWEFDLDNLRYIIIKEGKKKTLELDNS